MGRVRPFEAGDVPQVAALHRRVFPLRGGRPVAASDYDAYFREIFLSNPWQAPGPGSLVYEDGGEIAGFLGVVLRRMCLGDRPVWMAASSQFIVDPAHRGRLAGIALVRGLLEGPQDLTVADEAIDATRRLWEGLGGATASLYSLAWVKVLRPFEFALSRWRPGRTGWASASRLGDALAARLPGSPFRPPAPDAAAEELTGDALASCLETLTRDRALRPAYDAASANWLLDVLARKPGLGTLRKVLVRDPRGAPAGWYLYAGARGGLGEVIQLGARREMTGAVLDHLCAQAWRDGIAALAGRVDAAHVDELASRHCLFHHRGYWTLVHARDARLLDVLNCGDAFLTRLEGEWCLRFRLEVA